MAQSITDNFLSMFSGNESGPTMGKNTLSSGRNKYSIPTGEYNEFTGQGMANMLMKSGSGAEQIPTGFDNEYVEPTEFDFSKLQFGEDVINTFNPDIPERQPSAIEEPIQPMLMERGEVSPISPVFGKQSLAQMQLEKDEREKMAQVLRGYV